ncbi:MAG: amino acid adenylation domain-containing protein [Cyanobacteria bacterium P01_F01_bin.143]
MILNRFTKSADQKLSEISLISPEELEQLFEQQNLVDYPQDRLLPQLFEAVEQRKEKKESLALVTEEKSLTYTELNEQANQLAHYLRSLGVTNGQVIGIYLDRDSDLVISLLAILKTGAAYIPLDPSYPKERINYIINHAQISYLITKQNINEKQFYTKHQLSIINLEEAAENIQQQSNDNLDIMISPQDLAYVIYTSGSTGKPKGVAIKHSSLLNFLYSMQESPGINESDILLAVTTISFDIAALEIYLPLITGATVFLASKETTIYADKLGQKIAENNITMMQATPATWQMLVANQWQGDKQLKILCGGEALSSKLAAELLTLCKEVWNLYGPTETTIWSSVYKVENYNLDDVNAVAIGKPIANTQFYILDSQLNLVPQGVPGELYIGGAGLAHGYFKSPDLTAERFISLSIDHSSLNIDHLPLSNQSYFSSASSAPSAPSSRLYKTGDRVRQLPNCNFEYLGRLDNQVKIRGYRIELGEIEAVLTNHPAIQSALVIVRDDRLIAYFIPSRDVACYVSTEFDVSTLRPFLQGKLPSYMVPANIIQLESFPLTPNGKIDRRALAVSDNLQITNQDKNSLDSIIPQNPTEEILLGIWAEILGQGEIGTDDDFFELGGHSLLATRMISQIRQIFSIELPLRNLFEYPTIKQLSKNIDFAKQEQSENILAPTIEMISRTGELPLSFAQQRQWFLYQLEPDNPWYNISTAVKITGELDIEKLQKCFDILVKRQEILRTSFITVDGKAKLIINEQVKINLTESDLSSLSVKEKQKQIKQLQIDEAQQVFALDKSPLMRIKLLTLGDSEHILLLSLHHIIGDAWSMGVLVKEIIELYTREEAALTLKGTPSDKDTALYKGAEVQRKQRTPIIQYVDFAAWQRNYLQGEILESQVNYWQEQLADAPAISSFPTDYPRKSQASYQSAAYNFQLNDRVTQNLKQISRSNSGTLFITLFAALALLMHRYTDNDDLVIGTPIANRDRAELEGLIGFFANTLALRINLADNPSFTELLTRAREIALGAYSHQTLPFEQLIDKLQLERSLSYTPLFQVMLVLEEQAQTIKEVDGLTWEPLERVTTQAKFELTFLIKDTGKGLQGAIEYNQALFTADTIHRLAGHFRTLLKAIAQNPEEKISNISILSKGEWQQIVNKFNQSNNVAIDTCIHKLFEHQVSLDPNALAIVNEEEEITYGQLNEQANDWAHYLQSLGVRTETRVGVMCDRSIQTIIALIAILKAGGCYVPLDPNYPEQRLHWMLEDTGLNIVLTQTKYAEKLNTDNITLITIDGRKPSAPTISSASPASPENLAYITYTSGSTGIPKGVAIPHHGVVRLVRDPNYVSLNTGTICLHAAPINFDASTFEIWGALLNGGRVVILSTPVPSLKELAETITTQKINTAWLTAGLFHLMVDEQLDSLRQVTQLIAGGDVLSSSHITKFLQAHPQSSLINGYGPTESTTFACCYPMRQDTQIDRDRSIIGKPISNTQLYVLDKYLNPVPIGVSGELHIAGAGLARSYVNRADLTAEKFIPNSVGALRPKGLASRREAPLLYKTGDRVRYLADGSIEYLGRIDNQVKVRGFRVELGEIEAALSQIENIKNNVVLVRENAQGNKQLVAYVVPHNLEDKLDNQWREYLQNKLPDYLIPSIFVNCDRFPLTANGKIDRQALLEQEIIQPQFLDNVTQPQTEIEQKLTQIWSEILNLENVDINSNFFSLGGDSILAIQIIAKANQAGIKLTPRQLFAHQTIAELAAVATTDIISNAEQGLVSGSIPLTPIQKWFFEQDLSNKNHFNQSVLLEITQNLNLEILQQTLEQLLTHHDALRIRFTQTENGWEQYNSDVIKNIEIEQIDLSHLSKEEQTKNITEICDRRQASLNITEERSIKIAYFNLGEESSNRLLIIIHHLLIDGISWRILLEDLQIVYQQILNNKSVQLPAKTTSYKQWSEYLQNYAQEYNQSDINGWLEQYKYKNHSLPKDNISNINNDFEQPIEVTLNQEYTQALLQDSNQAYNTQIDDLLLTALVKTFAHYSNQSFLLIDLESQGRTITESNLDLSRTVGWFTNIYPVLLDLQETTDLAENIKIIKETLYKAKQQSFNYSISRYLQDNQQLKQLPIAPISFNYLGQFDNLQSALSIFKLASESTGLNSATENEMSHEIAINCSIINSQLQIGWNYNHASYKPETVINLAEQYIINLQQIINHCNLSMGSYTPSDFSLVDLEQNAIDSIVDLVDFDD